MARWVKKGKIIIIRDRSYLLRKWKRRLPYLIGLFLALGILGVVVISNIRDEYHTYGSSQARDYSPISVENGDYVLVTAKKELLGVVYASFSVEDKLSQKAIYQCPDLYRVRFLESIGWEKGTDNVLVVSKEAGTVRYVPDKGIWKKE